MMTATGDIDGCNEGKATAELVAKTTGPVATVGDNGYPEADAESFARCYDPAWGALKGRTRPVPGNHEYDVSKAAPYFEYFGAAAGELGRGWYSYDVGSWHVVALNSNCDAVDCDEQTTWLERDLSDHPSACIAAYWHHPRFTSGTSGGDKRGRRVLEGAVRPRSHPCARRARPHLRTFRPSGPVRRRRPGAGDTAVHRRDGRRHAQRLRRHRPPQRGPEQPGLWGARADLAARELRLAVRARRGRELHRFGKRHLPGHRPRPVCPAHDRGAGPAGARSACRGPRADTTKAVCSGAEGPARRPAGSEARSPPTSSGVSRPGRRARDRPRPRLHRRRLPRSRRQRRPRRRASRPALPSPTRPRPANPPPTRRPRRNRTARRPTPIR